MAANSRSGMGGIQGSGTEPPRQDGLTTTAAIVTPDGHVTRGNAGEARHSIANRGTRQEWCGSPQRRRRPDGKNRPRPRPRLAGAPFGMGSQRIAPQNQTSWPRWLGRACVRATRRARARASWRDLGGADSRQSRGLGGERRVLGALSACDPPALSRSQVLFRIEGVP